MKKNFLLVFFLAIFVLSACSTERLPPDLTGRRVQAVATTGMVADVVRGVGGEQVEVTTLMGPGVDPHLYKASESDVRALDRADIIFYSGLHLEAGLARVLERMGEISRAVAVTERIDRDKLIAPPEFSGAYDPHVWFDVALWMETVAPVRDALIALDPSHREIYSDNARRYLAELNALHQTILAKAGELPPDQRILITAHDAFNYFGRAYGFQVRGLQGISTASEASASDVTALADFIAANRVPAVFIETSVPRRMVEALQAAVRSRGWEVAIGGSLFSDALGDPDTPEGAYAGMVRYNIETIVSALKRK